MLIRNLCHSILILMLLFAAPLCAQTGKYLEQDSARFRVFYYAKDAGVVQELWRTLRARITIVEHDLGLALADTVTFVITPDQKEWARLTQGAPLWTNGLAYAERGVAILKSPSFGLRYGPFPTTAVHEYVHLLLHAGAPQAQIPRWLDEGLAQVLSGQLDYVETTMLARAALANRLHSFDQIEGLMGMNAVEARQGYAESAVAVQLLQLRYGISGLSNLVHELRAGKDFDAAFSQLFGVAPGTFENQYMAYVRSTYKLTLFSDTDLWVPAAFVILVLAAGFMMWRRRKKIFARWVEEERRARQEQRETWPPYEVNYTIIRSRKADDEDEGTPDEGGPK
jgi:hypothetical protein